MVSTTACSERVLGHAERVITERQDRILCSARVLLVYANHTEGLQAVAVVPQAGQLAKHIQGPRTFTQHSQR